MIKPFIKKHISKNLFAFLKNNFNIIKSVFKKPINNFFKKNNYKSVLLSYLRRPFIEGVKHYHTNNQECFYAAMIFDELNYNVDIVEYDYTGNIDYSKYDVIYGFGWPLVNRFLNNTDKKIVSIYYATGMEDNYNNFMSLKRIKEFYNKKNRYILSSARLERNLFTEQLVLVDAIITLGNSLAAETYKSFFNKVYNLPSFFYKTKDYREILANKNFIDSRKKFLWFGSGGLIHKGLDILLEIFASRKDIDLHICGPVEKESEFVDLYCNELYKTNNIHCHGFIDINSSKFVEILSQCAFCIYPTCGEGGSPAVLTTVGNGGLIPVVTKEATVEIGNFGVLISDISLESVAKAIDNCVNLSESELAAQSLAAGEYVNNNNSSEIYYVNLKKIISDILK
ncbi:MAG: glycosyl transferase, group 1 family protein [uncultured bacterium]|nr:MAG: glycosyl transferase, group 1 family protein [uncultured bacterium]